MGTVIFDLDGTLADTSADLIAAANACFWALGLGRPLDPERDKATAFHGGRAMLRLGFDRTGGGDEAAVDREYPHLLDHYARRIDAETRMYPGAVEAVEGLRRDGYRTAVCTNKPEGLAEDLLARLGVRDLFAALIGADTLPVRKPDPAPYVEACRRAGGEPARSLLVGDTLTDRKTAAAAGVPCILVTFGPEGEAVTDLDPEATIADYGELGETVRRLIGPA